MGTFVTKPAEVKKTWVQIDAEGLVLGRLAAEVAKILRGKHKASFSPYVDCGDNVIIINAEKVRLTGRKYTDKQYYWHTGHPGGIKSRSANKILEGAHPERVIIKAVERMVPRGALGSQQMRNLRVFSGPTHTHEAQQPVVLDLAARNDKNKRS